MISFLVVISFLLHGVTLLTIFILAKRISTARELEVKQEKVAREIEESFTAYLMDIKEENERLMNMLDKNGQNVEQSFTQGAPDGNTDKENSTSVPAMTNVSSSYSSLVKEDIQEQSPDLPLEDTKEKSTYMPPTPPGVEEAYEPSVQSRVYQLFDAGYSKEAIAKELHCGKTEVELMLKFHQRNV
ncbi:hypothetical protein ACFFGV_11385 [Pontibacillus salicampi]|uniref:Swarming motility protein SwrB n=1 Tax=Pontibacillus salicampi TaxID=1449801 RepID=A0ABV6LP29_9BACI